MRVGLLLKCDEPAAVSLAADLANYLKHRGLTGYMIGAPASATWDMPNLDEKDLAGKIDILVVLGGDGTLLHGASLVCDGGIPILGINLGRLGFLTSCPPTQGVKTLALALDGQLSIERRMRLRVVLKRKNGVRIERHAVNDAVISQKTLARLLEIDAFLDGNLIANYRADGLIIAAPTGSTAYNLAAGGPILAPHLEAMVITPICPHTLTNRPLVVPASATVTVRLGPHAQNVVLTIDGQWATNFESEDHVDIQTARQPMLLYLPVNMTHFDVLREKLNWGIYARG